MTSKTGFQMAVLKGTAESLSEMCARLEPPTNWLNQEMPPGTIVYRCSKTGSNTEYKIGIVREAKGNKVRVEWVGRPGYRWVEKMDGRYRQKYVHEIHDSFGSPGVDTLAVLVDGEDILREFNLFDRL